MSSARSARLLVIAAFIVLPAAAFFGAYRLTAAPVKPKPIALTAAAPPAAAYRNLQRKTTGACAGEYEVLLSSTAKAAGLQDPCTHGPDQKSEFLAADAAPITSQSLAAGSINCYGDGVSGPRIQAIYAVAQGQPDYYNQKLPLFRAIAASMNYYLDRGARKTGYTASFNWVTDSSCQVDVKKVIMPSWGTSSMDQTIAAVAQAGYKDPRKKYLIWTDDNIMCGMATVKADDRADPAVNSNNVGPSYARIDSDCRGYAELHETLHMLGAVQLTAPHSTGSFHCTDGHDVMCYQDGPNVVMTYPCPGTDGDWLLDCNNDDYMNFSPAPGSYLTSHWDIARSSFITAKPVPVAGSPTPPAAPHGLWVTQESQTGFILHWDIDDPQNVVTTSIEVDGQILATYKGAETWGTITGLQPGTTYKVRVLATNAAGYTAYSPFWDTTTLAPTPQLTAMIPHDLKLVSVNGSLVTFTAVIDYIPDNFNDYHWAVYRQNGWGTGGNITSPIVPTTTPQTYTFIDYNVYPQNVTEYKIRVAYYTGNVIGDSAWMPFSYTGQPNTTPPPACSNFQLRYSENGYVPYVECGPIFGPNGLNHHYAYTITGSGVNFTNNNYVPIYWANFTTANFDENAPYNYELTAGNTYTITVRSYDIWGNVSAPASFTFTPQ